MFYDPSNFNAQPRFGMAPRQQMRTGGAGQVSQVPALNFANGPYAPRLPNGGGMQPAPIQFPQTGGAGQMFQAPQIQGIQGGMQQFPLLARMYLQGMGRRF